MACPVWGSVCVVSKICPTEISKGKRNHYKLAFFVTRRNIGKLFLGSCVAVALLLIVFYMWFGGPDGPATTDTSSDKFTTIAEKVDFLEQYVTFRRTYRQLDYRIVYHNNTGGIPGPSDWDVTIFAHVPSNELPAWTSGLNPISAPKANWFKNLPKHIIQSGVSEWFGTNGVLVGINRNDSVIFYRNTTLMAIK